MAVVHECHIKGARPGGTYLEYYERCKTGAAALNGVGLHHLQTGGVRRTRYLIGSGEGRARVGGSGVYLQQRLLTSRARSINSCSVLFFACFQPLS